jgi:HEAT repeat protein
MATAPTPRAGFTDSLVGLLRGVSRRDMHWLVRRRSVAALLGAWGGISIDTRQRLETLDDSTIAMAFADVLPEGRTAREHAAHAARAFAPAAVSSVLLKLVGDTDEAVRHRAVDTLEAMTADAAESSREVDTTLLELAPKAIKCGGEDGTVRRQAAACMLALWTPAAIRGASLDAWLADPAVMPALVTAVRWCTLPSAAARAAEWLCREGLAKASLDRLSAIETIPERAAALARWHLLCRPGRACKLRGMKVNISVVRPMAPPAVRGPAAKGAPVTIAARGLVPAASEVAAHAIESKVGTATMCGIIGAEAPIRAQLAGRMLVDRDPRARLAGRGLATVAGLADFAFDAEECLARGAAMRWLDLVRAGERLKRAEVDQTATIDALRRSPHACVRAMAMDIRPSTSRERPGEASLRQRLAQRHHATGQLEALNELTTHDRLAACGGSVIALLEDETIDARVRAKAAITLGRMHDVSSLQALTRAVSGSETDPRVTANAIDALRRRRDQVGSVAAAPLAELKSSVSHQRVRASAIRLLASLKTSGMDCAGDVLEMLKDPRPAHRQSGAWLAGRLSRLAVDPTVRLRWTAELRHMCDHGSDPGLRARAAQALARIQPANGSSLDDWNEWSAMPRGGLMAIKEHAA